MMTMSRRNLAPFLVAAVAAVTVGLLGSAMTEIGPWYEGLRKPAWQPPDRVFAPVWTTIYVLTAIAGALAWLRSDGPAARRDLLLLFLLNAVLNVTWSWLFFHLQRPDWALFEVFLLWASIVLLVIACARRKPLSGWLLSPYLAWVSFAAVLNYAIVALNAPFPGA